jgi:hypothetical protein
VNPFETETMADLCLRQGHRERALAIYRRLLEKTDDEASRERIGRRIAAVEAAAAARVEDGDEDEDEDGEVGVKVRAKGDVLTIDWRLPAQTVAPTLEILVVRRRAAGVETENKTLAVDGPVGRVVLEVAGLHSARAAAGHVAGGRFVPIARS